MQEFKFACPVCGQHITAAAQAGGKQLECPTCFQKIIVPQAPTTGDSKLILSATQANRARPAPLEMPREDSSRPGDPTINSWLGICIAVVLVAGLAAAFFFWREKLSRWAAARFGAEPNQTAQQKHIPPRPVFPVPTNIIWTTEVAKVAIPPDRPAGRIHGSGFLCERATLQGGSLTLRQGRNWPPDLGLTINLFAQQGEDLGGKTVSIAPDRAPPLPNVILRWKDAQGKAATRTLTGGYALKAVFGQAVNGRMPGQIYIALPDEEKSFAAGTFDAEIRRAQPPKPRTPSPAPGAALKGNIPETLPR